MTDPREDILSLAVSEGWMFVPIKPTEEMLEDADRARAMPEHYIRDIYTAMLAAAPTPPAAEAPGQEPVAWNGDKITAAFKAVETAMIAMHIGSAMPGVSDQYDFGPAIAETEAIVRDRAAYTRMAAPPTYADAEAKLRPMSEAPQRGREIIVATTSRAGCEGYLIAHWASDRSGSEQPPFEGWFYWTGYGFSEIPPGELLGWYELPPIRSLASPAPKGEGQ